MSRGPEDDPLVIQTPLRGGLASGGVMAIVHTLILEPRTPAHGTGEIGPERVPADPLVAPEMDKVGFFKEEGHLIRSPDMIAWTLDA